MPHQPTADKLPSSPDAATSQARLLRQRRTALIGLGCAGAGLLAAPWRLAGAQTKTTGPASTPADAIKSHLAQATRLSILTDRITRAQVQRSLNVLTPKAERIHKDSISEARQLLSGLRQGSGSPTTRAALSAAEPQLVAFMAASETLLPDDRGALARLAVQADHSGEAVDKVVAGYLLDLGVPTAAILQTTANLQRLTQHLAVHYLLARAGVQPQEQMKEVTEARQAFETGLSALKTNPVTSQRITTSIGLLEGQWTFLRMALSNTSVDPLALQNASTTSERTLEVLTELYGHYETALRQG